MKPLDPVRHPHLARVARILDEHERSRDSAALSSRRLVIALALWVVFALGVPVALSLWLGGSR